MTREQWKNRKVKQPSNHIWLKDEMTDKEPLTDCKWADLALRYWKKYKVEVRK